MRAFSSLNHPSLAQTKKQVACCSCRQLLLPFHVRHIQPMVSTSVRRCRQYQEVAHALLVPLGPNPPSRRAYSTNGQNLISVFLIEACTITNLSCCPASITSAMKGSGLD